MQVSYAIGVAQPLSVHVDTYGTGTIPDKDILDAVLKNFDFRPGAPIPSVRPFFTIPLSSPPAASSQKCCNSQTPPQYVACRGVCELCVESNCCT